MYVTGCAEDERAEAEAALAAYIARKYSFHSEAPRPPSAVLVTDMLGYYTQEVAPGHARPDKTAERVLQLGEFWQGRYLSDVSPSTCREYVRWREEHDWKSARPDKTGRQARKVTVGGARRELEVLKAAINYYVKRRLCDGAVHVFLPPKTKGRVEWMTRSEAARLLWICWRYREIQTRRTGKTAGQPRTTSKYPLRHLVRFILTGLYTGARSDDICTASFSEMERRGYINLDIGLWQKKPAGHVESNKRAPDIRLPPRLLAHMRRWRRLGAEHVVEFNGKPVAQVGKGFTSAVRLAKLRATITPHILRHTAATWLMQNAADLWQAAGYLGMSLETLSRVYGHHHPDHQSSAIKAITSKQRTD
ncbi:MAG: tyrosine-type recombinase/integrase [Alphaproteobacteria bacterium]|nr:tyrosine-type recombinase/integrase [Alphaproteobacteria bacterium]